MQIYIVVSTTLPPAHYLSMYIIRWGISSVAPITEMESSWKWWWPNTTVWLHYRFIICRLRCHQPRITAAVHRRQKMSTWACMIINWSNQILQIIIRPDHHRWRHDDSIAISYQSTGLIIPMLEKEKDTAVSSTINEVLCGCTIWIHCSSVVCSLFHISKNTPTSKWSITAE